MITWAVIQAPPNLSALASQPAPTNPWFRGFDIVVGYQVSWILMFADFSRYTKSERTAAMAVFLGLLLTSLWMMPLGLAAARVAASADPGAMMSAIGLGWAGAALMVLATVTTNFVNIYMSGLAWKSLFPRFGDQASIWSIGVIGTAAGLFYGAWLDRYAEFMMVLGGVLVPVGGVLIAHFRLSRTPVRVPDLYDSVRAVSRHARAWRRRVGPRRPRVLSRLSVGRHPPRSRDRYRFVPPPPPPLSGGRPRYPLPNFRVRVGLAVDVDELGGADVGVTLRGRELRVAEQLLDGAEVGAALEQVGGERMAQRVRADAEA